MSNQKSPIEIIGNRYELLRIIGQGAMGVVYEARDRLVGQHVALKRVTVQSGDLQFTQRPQEDTTQ